MKRKIVSFVLAAALACGGAIQVNATSLNNVPDTAMPVDPSIVTATAHRAASPLPDMLGANTTSGSGIDSEDTEYSDLKIDSENYNGDSLSELFTTNAAYYEF